jgi:sialate O-acetylesterase
VAADRRRALEHGELFAGIEAAQVAGQRLVGLACGTHRGPVAHQALHDHRLVGRLDLRAKRLEIDVVSNQYLRAVLHEGGRTMVQRICAALALAFIGGAARAEAPLMAAIFADHAVLQRDRPIVVWGTAAPGEEVSVSMGAVSVRPRTTADGRWEAALPALSAGGPYTLTAKTATRTQSIGDVLIGDVWLCSGQSNMEWTVRQALNADWEADHSANPRLRHVTVPRDAPIAPHADLRAPLAWKIAGPATTRDFSAVCYYFARELQKSIDVPQGLVLSAWGGTRIEAWLSAPALRALGGHDAALDLLGLRATDPAGAARRWGEQVQQWWEGQGVHTQGIRPWLLDPGSGVWTRAPSMERRWEDWGTPELAQYDGMLWYRARATLTPAQVKQAATLSLGVVDDVDAVWINGLPMASGDGERPRVYAVPPKHLKAGENFVVVSVFDMWGGGGMHGADAARGLRFADGTTAPLVDWEYQKPPRDLTPIVRAPWEPYAGINILHNGMIAPLGPLGLRGVAWYQGEANGALEDALRYEKQLGALFADWRRQFRAPLPFLVVQLASFGPLAQVPVDSGWARLRDAQRRAVAADGNAALIVTHDIGNRDDIHPANKQDVGERLARAARRVVYGEKISASGAQPLSARRSGNGVQVQLGGHDGRLVVVGARDPSGFELCAQEGQGTCRFVGAKLGEDDVVTLEDSPVAPSIPTRVRFCWADSPLCNLFDSTGLPVGPFELPIE